MKIPLEILKIKDPDGETHFRAIISFQDAVAHTSQSQILIKIQNEYASLVDRCQTLVGQIRSERKFMADSELQWRLANAIYSFTKEIEKDGYIFANSSEALSRDLGISKSQLNYLAKFRKRYASVDQVSKKINWSKYRELMDFPSEKSRKECEALIKQGKIKSDKEIREFKRKVKIGRA